MLFSTNTFIFLFLPCYLLVYYLSEAVAALVTKKVLSSTTRKLFIPNAVLLLMSLFFYYWDVGKFLVVFGITIVVNYFMGRFIFTTSRPKLCLILGVIFNLSILFYYKYFNFLYDQMSLLLNALGNIQLAKQPTLFLPLGISFYTFMAISYLVDSYKKRSEYSSLLNFGMYLSMFPHLVAGPIVRYSEIAEEIKSRRITTDALFEGVWRFSLGLGKKVILANNLGAISDKIFALPATELTTTLSWIGVICYTFQIYFDFSGYSDMAIGLARFFGFHFPENFNAPYRSQNVTEFWKRWHMSLSRWFRDYLYIPLGGNRKGNLRTYVNLSIVFILCGFWHGASWTFVVWGAYHGILLVIERILNQKFHFSTKGLVGTAITFLLVMIGWVFFRSTSIGNAWHYIKTMFGFSAVGGFQYFTPWYYLDSATVTYLIAAALASFLPFEKMQMPGKILEQGETGLVLAKGFVAIFLTLYSVTILSKAGFRPFLYFQF
ncbi:MAG: MBOAT family protein [Deltaproteobacteria bacterium]|nr:MBOAT family protein [Deltaproteobacteria bacterium]